MRHCVEHDAIGQANDTWRCNVFKAGLLLIKGGSHFSCVGTNLVVTMLWKAVRHEVKKGLVTWSFAPWGPDALSLIPVFAFEDWQIIGHEWLSPMKLAVLNGRVPSTWPSTAVARQAAAAKPFLKYAAEHAFWDLASPILERLAKVEYSLKLSGEFPEKLHCLIQTVLCCSDADAAVYMQARCNEQLSEDHHQMLASAEAEDAMGKDDWKEAAKCCATEEALVESVEEVQDFVLKKVALAKKKLLKRKAIMTEMPELSASEARAQELLPAGAKIIMDTFNGRWQCWFRPPSHTHCPWTSKSLSWGSRPHLDCIRECLRWAWTQAEAFGDTCPYKGVLQPKPPASASGVASGSGRPSG